MGADVQTQQTPTASASAITSAPVIDGRLDDDAWAEGQVLTGFIQREPTEGRPVSERTEVRVAYDEEALYIGAWLFDSDPTSLVFGQTLRDASLNESDAFVLVLDTYLDRQNGFVFGTTPAGIEYDGQVANEGQGGGGSRQQRGSGGGFNLNWDGSWEVATSTDSRGWYAEMRIPFTTLRYGKGGDQTWGLNFERRIRRNSEEAVWAPIPRQFNLYRVSLAGTLDLAAPATRIATVNPYVLSNGFKDYTVTSPDAEFGSKVGIDAKVGLNQSLTLDLTVNTDFAQAEVDDQQVNLTRFSLFFPEKRAFFLENAGTFSVGSGRSAELFFSRRIGLQGGQVVPILGGGRLTGKMGAFSIGALNMQTDDETVSGAESTNFTVLRVKRDLFRRSSLGMIYTGRSVSLVGDGANHAYGVDGNFSFFENVNFNGYFAKTRTPDITGQDTSYQARFDYAADRWGVQVDHLLVEDNFIPEVGFLRRDDFRRTFVSGRFSPRPAGIESVRRFLFETSLDYTLTADTNLLETRQNQLRFVTEFENSDQLRFDTTRSYELLEDPFTIADGVTIPVGGYAFSDVNLSYQFGAQRKASGSFSVQRGAFFNGDITAIGFTRARVVVTEQLSLEPGVSFNWIDLPQGSFTTNLVTTRVNYTFTPRMFFSGLLQYNSSNDALTSNLRLRWEYQPGSELFVVYTEDRDTNTLDPRRFSELRNRGFVVKFNRLFRY